MSKIQTPAVVRPAAQESGLRGNSDFVNLWIAESISQIGSHISLIALPLLAILALDASPAQMGLLSAAGTAPFLVIGLIVGVWVDRVRRRPLMIAADLLRAVLLLTVPVAWWGGFLRIELLYAVAVLTGSLTVVFDVAWMSFLPSIVRRGQLVDANSRLQVSASVAQVSGPGIGGVLVGIAGAPLAILTDAASFALSALFLLRAAPDGAQQKNAVEVSSIRRDILEGLRVVFRDSVLRALVYSKVLVTFSAGMFFAVYMLFMAEDLGLGATAIGIVFATGGIGSLLGAVIAERASSRFGTGVTVIHGQFWFGAFGVAIPLAVLFPAIALVMVVLSEFAQWMAHIVSQVNELSIRQAKVPDQYLGRVNSVFQFFGRGMTPIGALMGGFLGEVIGIPMTLVVATVGFFFAFLFVVFSPVRRFRLAHDQ
ncbi:MAG: MFS transporter [Thermomicrobiales bacterium]